MIITNRIDMDFVSKNPRDDVPQIRAVQGDCCTRVLELALYADGTAWTVPDGAVVQMRYRKPDGTGGVYDTLPDGTQAWGISGNVVSVTMAPQMLAASGLIRAQVVLARNEKYLATFHVHISVEEDLSAGVVESEDYINMQAWLVAELNGALTEAAASGEFNGATFVPAVSGSGVLSWSNDKGLENPEPVNINAPQGILPVENGGTAAADAQAARKNLGALGNSDVVNNLTGTATDVPLSAYQGKVLNEKIDAVLPFENIAITSDYAHGACMMRKLGPIYIFRAHFWNVTVAANTETQIGTLSTDVPFGTAACVLMNAAATAILGYGTIAVSDGGIYLRANVDITNARAIGNLVLTS